MNLNIEQQKAVSQINWPILILAWAWSWKTATLTKRIENMIKIWINPNSILAVTFTNKARNEMKERVWSVLWVKYSINPYKNKNLPTIGTFHSIWVQILKEITSDENSFNGIPTLKKDFLIYDETDKNRVLKSIIKDDLKLDEKNYSSKTIWTFISNAKNAWIRASDYEKYIDSYIKEIVFKVYKIYEKKLEENNAIDFDDILLKTLEVLKDKKNLEYYQNKWEYIMIDEYQDTNQVQYDIVKILASKNKNLCVVGDDWQCLIWNTKIQTINWLKAISEVKVWEKILSYDWSKEKKYYEISKIYKNKVREDVYEIKTKSWKIITSTKKHIFFSNPEDNNWYYEYAVYLMYKEGFWYRIWYTRYKWLSKSWKILWIRKRLNWERADFAWILQTTNDIKEAKYLEQLYSFKYSIPQTVFQAKWKLRELTQDDINNIYKNIDTKKNVLQLFNDFDLNKDYPHIIASSTNRFDSLRVNINFLAMWWNEKNRRFWMYRVTLHTSNEKVINILKDAFPKLCRKSKLWIRIDKELADYTKIWNLAQDIYTILKNSWFNVLLNEKISFLKQSYIFTPASNLRPWFWITVFNEKTSKYENDVIIETKKIKYVWDVYDLDISRTHNFVANNILVHNSIYSWRWANMQNILNFKKDYKEATVIKLEQNYRSTQNIINAANKLIKNNKTALDKTLFTQNEVWEKIIYIDAPSDRIEASTIAKIIKEKQDDYSKNLILYRTNAQSRWLEEALIYENIPYRIVWWLKFYDRKEIKDILSYLRLILNPNDIVSAKRIINTPPRKIWDTTIKKILEYKENYNLWFYTIIENIFEVEELNNWSKNAVNNFYLLLSSLIKDSFDLNVFDLITDIIEKIGYKEYLMWDCTKEEYEAKIDNLEELKNVASNYIWISPRDSLSLFLEEISLLTDSLNQEEKPNAVTLMTIHTSKWLEYDRVFITWLEDGIFPSSRSFWDIKELEEERRLMYVAMTRAKKELFLSRASERFYFWNYVSNPESRFLKEIDRELIEEYQFKTNSFFENTNNFSWFDIDDNNTFKVKKNIIQNDVSDFNVWDYINHPRFGDGIIISITWDIANISFRWWTKKMNIKIAPIKKI